jgi:hypothetical protein
VDVKARVNGQDADSPTGPTLMAGGTAAFTYVVTNPGNVPLSSILVKDNNGTPGNVADDFNAVYSSGDANSNGQLDVGETWTYSAVRTIVVGQYSTSGTVTTVGNAQSVMDTDPANYFGVAPNADFNGDSKVDAGDFVRWRKSNGMAGGAIHAQGDANYDGAVNGTDYAIWRSQFGTTLEGSSGTALNSSGLAGGVSVPPVSDEMTSASAGGGLFAIAGSTTRDEVSPAAFDAAIVRLNTNNGRRGSPMVRHVRGGVDLGAVGIRFAPLLVALANDARHDRESSGNTSDIPDPPKSGSEAVESDETLVIGLTGVLAGDQGTNTGA